MRLSVFFPVVVAAVVFALFAGPAEALASEGGCYKRVRVKERGHKHAFIFVKAKCSGPRGRRGPRGAKGADGREGRDGRDGPPGVDGAPGADGADGADGTDGAPGADGKDGTDGTDGRDGADGRDGRDGENGRDGRDGEKGEKGDKGDKGEKGEKGDKGDKGDPGRPGVVGDPVTVTGEAVTVPASGSAVARGGRCPEHTVLVGGAFDATSPVLVRGFQPSVRLWQGTFSSQNGPAGKVTVSSVCMPTR